MHTLRPSEGKFLRVRISGQICLTPQPESCLVSTKIAFRSARFKSERSGFLFATQGNGLLPALSFLGS